MDTQFISELAARIPYGIVCEMGPKNDIKIVEKLNWGGLDQLIRGNCSKPYLFPLSSMTEEQIEELIKLINTGQNDNNEFMRSLCRIEFYHKNHFDYRGLIDKGLAIDATEKNIY